MMEKRMLIAVALSMVVFFVFNQYITPPPKPAPPAAQEPGGADGAAAPQEATAPTALARTPAPPAVTEAAPAPAPASEEAAIELASAQVAATFTTHRGLTHWVLDAYRTSPGDDAPSVDLAVSPGADDPLTLTLFPAGEVAAFSVEGSSASAVTFAAVHHGVVERRQWRIDGYRAELTWTAQNRTGTALPLQPRVAMREGLDYGRMSQYEKQSPIVARGTEVERLDEGDIEDKPSFSGVRWAGFDDKYFLKVAIPRLEQGQANVVVREAGREAELSQVEALLALPDAVVAPGETWTGRVTFYLGPKSMPVLHEAGSALEKSVDYGFFDILARPLLVLLNLLYGALGNYGLAIILLTIFIKILFFPLTKKSMVSMKRMQQVAPKLEQIKKKYEKDPDRRNREMMELYKTEGVNPLSGCLPMLLQIPVFFALYMVLLNSIELRHAPFMLWVNDLSSPENLFSIPLPGFELPFRLLPLLMGGSMFLQQKMTPSTMDKAQQQIMMIMPVVLTFVFWGFPSGLVLYWLVNNLLTIGQQWWINRSLKSA